MRCLVWRYDGEEPWRIFGINRMHLGDRPAAAGLEVAKKKVADLGKQIDEQTAHIITRGYVDDGLGGGPEDVVRKLMGAESFRSPEGDRQDQTLSYRGKQGEEQALSYRGRKGEVSGPLPKGLAGRSPSRTLPDEKHNVAEEQEVPGAHLRPTYSGTVTQIMSRGGFKVKYMVCNGEDRPEILELFGGSVLGLPWDTAKDAIVIKMVVNLSARKQGVRTGHDLHPGDEDLIKGAVLTRRVLMSQIHGIFDPLGLLSPITIKFKLVLQHLVQAEVDWDEPLEGDLRGEAEVVCSVLPEVCSWGGVLCQGLDALGILGRRKQSLRLLPVCQDPAQGEGSSWSDTPGTSAGCKSSCHAHL